MAGTPSGLDVAGQSSSPYDLALIFRALIADPATAAVLATPTAQMPAVEGRSPGYQIQSQNPLLPTYPGNLGGKTGFTDAARHTFVTAAERDGRRLVVSVMDTENTPVARRRPGGAAPRLGLRRPGRHRRASAPSSRPATSRRPPSPTASRTRPPRRPAATGAAAPSAAGVPVVPWPWPAPPS